MRLFAALNLDEGAHAHLGAALASVRENLRWSDPATWHITLAFYGEVESGRVPDLTAALTETARRHLPLALELRGAATFGSALVIGVRAAAGLNSLAMDCRGAVRAAAVPLDDRPYRPHLTVGRSPSRSQPPRAAATALSSYVGPRFTPTELRLVRSHLGPPLRHEPIALLPLGAG